MVLVFGRMGLGIETNGCIYFTCFKRTGAMTVHLDSGEALIELPATFLDFLSDSQPLNAQYRRTRPELFNVKIFVQ